MTIHRTLFDSIVSAIPPGGTLLELGSGKTSQKFSKHFTVYSVEHSTKYLNRYDTNYIYAPLKSFNSEDAVKWFGTDEWYQLKLKHLPKKYDALLIDGPPRKWRPNFYYHINMFDLNVPWFFDDAHRPEFYRAIMFIAQTRGIDAFTVKNLTNNHAWVKL